MRQVVEITGTVPPDVHPPSVIDPDIDRVRDRIAEFVRADWRWKVAGPVTITVTSEAGRTYRIHCTLDTVVGDVPILPGDPAPPGGPTWLTTSP